METKVLHVSALTFNTDLPPCLLDASVGTEIANFIPVDGALVTTELSAPAPYQAGYVPREWRLAPWPSVPTACLNILYGQVGSRGYFILSGLSADYMIDGSTAIDITYAEKVAAPFSVEKNNWTSCSQGFNTIINNEEGYPEVWKGQ